MQHADSKSLPDDVKEAPVRRTQQYPVYVTLRKDTQDSTRTTIIKIMMNNAQSLLYCLVMSSSTGSKLTALLPTTMLQA
jgi:hypothetical protein